MSTAWCNFLIVATGSPNAARELQRAMGPALMGRAALDPGDLHCHLNEPSENAGGFGPKGGK